MLIFQRVEFTYSFIVLVHMCFFFFGPSENGTKKTNLLLS